MIASTEGFNNPQEKPPLKLFLLLFVGFLLFQLAFRYPYLATFSFVNEDASLIRLAVSSLERYGLLYWFQNSYGPAVLRPLQLLGLALQEQLFSGAALGFHLYSVALLAVSQTLLVMAFRPLVGLSAALFSVVVIGIAQMSSEPLFWISDQHDLYLLFFYSFAFLVFSHLVTADSPSLWQFLLLFCSYWGAFFSNEKAVVLPVLFSLFSLVTGTRLFVRVAVSGGGALVTYFAYRYSILGVFIGGYSSGVFPHEVTFSFVYKTLLSVFFTPFRQNTMYASTVSGVTGLILVFLLFILVLLERKHWKKDATIWLSLFVAALIVASLPVVSYLLPYNSYRIFSTRLHWMILLTFVPFLAVLFGGVFALKRLRKTGLVVVFLLLLLIGAGGRGAVQKFSRASKFSDRALELYLDKCHCANPQEPQTTGLPEIFAGAHVFSEAIWVEESALYHGLPRCEGGETGCRLRFRRNRRGKLVVTSKLH